MGIRYPSYRATRKEKFVQPSCPQDMHENTKFFKRRREERDRGEKYECWGRN